MSAETRALAEAALEWESAVEACYTAKDGALWRAAMQRRYIAAERLGLLAREYGNLGPRHPLRDGTEQARAARGIKIEFAE